MREDSDTYKEKRQKQRDQKAATEERKKADHNEKVREDSRLRTLHAWLGDALNTAEETPSPPVLYPDLGEAARAEIAGLEMSDAAIADEAIKVVGGRRAGQYSIRVKGQHVLRGSLAGVAWAEPERAQHYAERNMDDSARVAEWLEANPGPSGERRQEVEARIREDLRLMKAIGSSISPQLLTKAGWRWRMTA